MNTCTLCGKQIKRGYKLCYDCDRQEKEHQRYLRYSRMTPQEREDERERYYSTECDMCGKEGASLHSDGRNYCDRCWQVWNS